MEDLIMVFEKVKAIVARELNVDEASLTMETNFVEDLGADSLDAVEIIMAVEDEFGVEVGDDDAQGIRSIGDIVKMLEEMKK